MRHADPDISAVSAEPQPAGSMQSLVDRAPFGICRISLTRDRVESVNLALCTMLGYSEAELLKVSVSKQLYAGAPNRAEITELWARDRRLHAQETHLQRKDGSLVRVRVTAYLTPNPDGELDQCEAYFEDLTEQSVLEQQIRAVQKLEAVGRLAGGVAHDFNNILLVIKLSTEMMLAQITPDNPLTRHLLQVSNAADRATALTRQMLAFSRRQVMQPRVVNVNSIVGEISHMLRRMIGEDIELVTQLADQLPNTVLDPDQLGQVVFNLAVNARDAMPNGGLLHVETASVQLDEAYAQAHTPVQPGSYVMLAVTDTGAGISKADVPRIFDPFFTTKETGKGTGLGLAIVYGIVKQSGGYIWVYSEPGLGTTFKLYFPVTRDHAVPALSRADAPGRPNGEIVLIVEDDAAIRANVRDCLQQLGYTALESGSGEDALQLCEQHHGSIDLVMTDLVMPGMSGHETAQRMSERFPGTRLLYTSGYSEDGAARRELLHEGAAFLEKPYTVADLARAVQRALTPQRFDQSTSAAEEIENGKVTLER